MRRSLHATMVGPLDAPDPAAPDAAPAGFVPIERASLAHRATELIRRAIVSGTLAPGEHISLRDLALRLGVSATPIREALIHLNAVGLVEYLPGRVQIASPTPAAIGDAFDLREALEGMAARLAASRRSEEQAARIEQLAGLSHEAAKAFDQEAFRRHDSQFHRSIGRAAGSAQLERYLSNALDLALTLRNLRVDGRPFRARSAPMHLLSAAAIRRRDPDEAERASREHVRQVRAQVMEEVRPDRAG